MSVKSTMELTREQAEKLYLEMMVKLVNAPQLDAVLEAMLEQMNDLLHDGEGFTNYHITNHPNNRGTRFE